MIRDTLLFFLTLTILHLIVHATRGRYVFDGPRWWPLSIFNPRSPTPADIGMAILVAAGFAAALWRLEKTQYRSTAEIAVFGLLLILGTNAVQGSRHGFVEPTSGGQIQYYHDARRHPEPPATFLRHFNTVQPTLRDHGKTHPPGAVLLFWLLIAATGSRPTAISVVIAVLAALLTVWFYRLFLAAILPNVNGSTGVFLLLLLPAVQIYYCATLDAVIAPLLLGAVALFALSPTPGRIAGSVCCLIAASFLTFGVAWVLPLLLVVEIHRRSGRQSLLRLATIGAALIGFYLALRFSSGFDYLQALRTATRLENPEGFRLLTEPLSYFFTRVEDVCEIALFTGPILLSLSIHQWQRFRRESVFAGQLCVTALGTIAALFLTGAYRTGETARACLFLTPYLILPIIAGGSLSETTTRRLVFCAVFGQALLMQMLGRYHW